MPKMQHSIRLGDADVAQIKWDYVVDNVEGLEPLALGAALDFRGYQGFELVQILGGNAIFKRLGVHDITPDHP